MSLLTVDVAVADFEAAGCSPTPPAGKDQPGLWYALCPVCLREAAIGERDGEVVIECSQECSRERIADELHFRREQRGTLGSPMGVSSMALTDAPGLQFLTPAEIRAHTPPEPDWLLGGYIAPGVLTIGPAGKPKVGKSTLAFALVRAIREDAGTFLGRTVRQLSLIHI